MSTTCEVYFALHPEFQNRWAMMNHQKGTYNGKDLKALHLPNCIEASFKNKFYNSYNIFETQFFFSKKKNESIYLPGICINIKKLLHYFWLFVSLTNQEKNSNHTAHLMP